MTLKLYGHPASLCTRRVLLVLAEKGIEYEFVNVDFMTGEQKRAPYEERMPFGQIPALQDGSLRLYESRAIGRYLASKYRSQGIDLLPPVDDTQGWAHFEQFASVEYSQFYDAAVQVLGLKLFNPAFGIPSDETTTKANVEKLHAKLDVLDKILSKQSYLGGPGFTIVDTFYMPAVNSLYKAGEGPAFEQRKNLGTWWNKVSSRESWKKVSEN
ncbi:hypothetical protein CDV31_009164 [Fusarium ambrosium]|uniref:glutathione transferase n=1 Tax=Fusarium ambrosium TaxID=131363 RepID=A0A428TWF3_9HYPO|nr:hypothetical protein CDV31_009164 [Fusarium ambrosium]